MFRALRLRLALGNAVFLAAIMILFGLAALHSYRTDLDAQATEELQSIAANLSMVVGDRGVAALADVLDAPADAAILVGVYSDDARYLGGTGARPDWLEPKGPFVTDERIEGEVVRFVTDPVRLPDGTVGSLVVARSLRRLDEAIAASWDAFVRGLIVVVLLSGLFGWWVSARMIRPVARSFEAQRAFAADASHELRTPLTFIRAAVEVLAPAKPDLGRQVLGEIDYMASLTDRLLLLARAEDGRMRVAPAPFDLSAVCRASAERGRGAHGAAVEVGSEGAQAPVAAVGDPVLTATIVDALVDNAVRHGGGSAELRCANGGRTARVEVVDRGRGITDGDLERLFDRFARIDQSRDRATGGAGLGLPIARTLARAQGGDVRLSPTPGGGLTATLELPAGGDATQPATTDGLIG